MITIPSADLNRAIAQLCGWHVYNDSLGRWQCINGSHRTPLRRTDVEAERDLPQYCSDLNAMAQAEALLTPEQCFLFFKELCKFYEGTKEADGVSAWMWHASARARAEALYAVLGRREGGA